jgi:ABC-2 type transport system ATP-binding protein
MDAMKNELDAPVVQIEDLRKRYGPRWVLDGVTFDVYRGEIFGFLGANGAGKTTTLEILEGLRRADSGIARVFGLDVRTHVRDIRQRIGVSLQSTRYWGLLTVRETIELFRSMYRRALPLDELVAMFDLEPSLNRPMRQLSGGNYQRVVLALALVNDPELVLLDEPTTGLDPNARQRLWDVVRSLRSRGRTVILTTHYMDEAQALCDRVAIIHGGRIAQIGTPQELVQGLPANVAICFSTAAAIELPGLETVGWCHRVRALDDSKYLAYCADLDSGMRGLLEWAAVTGTGITNIETRVATLDDVFVRNTNPAGALQR